MDLKQLLGKLDLIESMKGAEKHPTGPKFTGYWKGTDAGTPGNKMVGGSAEFEESILKDLSKGPTPKTREQELAEQFEAFLQALEEENLGVTDKRPLRQGSRPARDYGKTGEHSKRYTYEKVNELFEPTEEYYELSNGKVVVAKYRPMPNQEPTPGTLSIEYVDPALMPSGPSATSTGTVEPWTSAREGVKQAIQQFVKTPQTADESRGHKIVATKLKDLERKPASDEDYAKHVERMKADQKEYLKKNPKSIYKKVDETDVVPTGQQTMAQKTGTNDPKQAAQTNQAISALKAGTQSAAPAPMIAKALDAASQGKAVNATDMKNIEPLMKDMATVAQDPKLAGQFKTLAQQIQQVQKKQQTT